MGRCGKLSKLKSDFNLQSVLFMDYRVVFIDRALKLADFLSPQLPSAVQ